MRVSVTVAATVLAVAATMGLSGCKSTVTSSPSASPVPISAGSPSAGPSVTTPSPTVTSSPTTPSPSASATAPPSAPPTPTPSATTTIPAKLKVGSSGPAVVELQHDLNALGYWLGTADGKFGGATQQAVWALQKAAGQSRSGVVTAKTWRAIKAGTKPHARSTSGQMIEVDLKRDLLMFVDNGHVDYVLNTSTGGGYSYQEQGRTETAVTPKGHFSTYRVINGPHTSVLGPMYRPRYFNGGIAIHGDGYVPAHPVSHGCVRVTNAAINMIWAKDLDPMGRKVWVY
jgi:hypothetical protein